MEENQIEHKILMEEARYISNHQISKIEKF
jgi:hypothetical protein